MLDDRTTRPSTIYKHIVKLYRIHVRLLTHSFMFRTEHLVSELVGGLIEVTDTTYHKYDDDCSIHPLYCSVIEISRLGNNFRCKQKSRSNFISQ